MRADRRLEVRDPISRRVDFAGLQDAFQQLHAGNPDIIKAVVRP